MEHAQDRFRKTFERAVAALSIDIEDRCFHLFETYFNELQKWNQAINLTSIHDEEEIIIKHFIDSLAGLKQISISKGTRILDVGAGAGFPSIPLKLACPQSAITLVEPSKKKSAFLRYMIGTLNISDAEVISEKLECLITRSEIQGLFDYIVVRAFNVNDMGNILVNLLTDGGKLVLFRATKVERNFSLQGLALIQEVEYELPFGYGHRILSTFGKQWQ